MEAGEREESGTVTAATSNELGAALLSALGIDPKQALSLSLVCEAGEPAVLTITRLMPRDKGEAAATELQRYRLEPIDATAGADRDESASLGSQFRTTHRQAR